jgi:hypothetical protein
MVISRISLVKMRPRLASVAAFLCLIVAHFEWPDIEELLAAARKNPSEGATHDRYANPLSFAGPV